MTAPGPHNRLTPGNAPVTDHEADALDTWLESITARHVDRSSRHVDRSRDISRRSENGHVVPATSLYATAEAFHARLARSEHEAEPDVPVDAIWEKIMGSKTLSSTPAALVSTRSPRQATTAPGRAAELVSARASAPAAQSPARTIPTWLSGSHWAVSAFMLAAVVVGIVALYGSFAGSPGPNDDPATNPNFAMASPGETTPSADTALLQPITPEECDVEPRALEEVGALMQDPDETAPLQYGPVSPVNEELAVEITSANRTYQACRMTSSPQAWRAMTSPRLIYEAQGEAVSNPYAGRTYDEYVARNRELSNLLLPDDAAPYMVMSDQEAPLSDDGSFYDESGFGEVILPDHIVQLADGRIGGPQSWLRPANYDEILESYGESQATPTTLSFTTVRYFIFAQDPTQGNRWVLDETLELCVDRCDTYYALVEQNYDQWSRTGPTPQASTTPAATPVATPQSTVGDDSTTNLQPITPDECDVEALSAEEVSAITQLPGEAIERTYVPIGPVDDDLVQDIATADRAWQSCYVYGTAGQRAALQSPRLTRDGPGVQPDMEQDREDVLAELDRFDATRELGDVMLTGDWQDYYIESDLFVDPVAGVVQTVPDFIPTIPVPEQAIHLTDGRIAIPIMMLVPPGTYPFSTEDVDDIPYGWVQVHILTQDPSQDGRWVMDEEIFLCTGDCDVARAETVEYIDYVDGLVPNADEATPAATPQARRDGQAA